MADLPDGVLLRFVTTGYGYDSYEKEEAREHVGRGGGGGGGVLEDSGIGVCES